MLTTEIGTEAAMIAAEIVLKVTVLMLVAAAAGWMLRSRSASLRYALGVATMAAVLCVAPVAVVGPRIEVRALDGVVEWWEARRALAVTVLEDGEDPGRVARDLDPVRIAEVGPVQRTWPLAAVPEPSRGIPWLPVLWAMGAITAVLRFVTARRIRNRLFRDAERPQDRRLKAEVAAAALRSGVRAPLRVVESSHSDVPVTFGVRRPTVVLPSDFSEWPDARRGRALDHELAHVRDRHAAHAVLTDLVCAIFWFHPLVWWARREIARAAEEACDDRVLLQGAEPETYASDLVAVCRRNPRPPRALTFGFFRGAGLGRRVGAILDPRRSRSDITPGMRALIVFLGVLLSGITAAIAAGSAEAVSPPDTSERLEVPTGSFTTRWTDGEGGAFSASFTGRVDVDTLDWKVVGLEEGSSVRVTEEGVGSHAFTGVDGGLRSEWVGAGPGVGGRAPSGWTAPLIRRGVELFHEVLSNADRLALTGGFLDESLPDSGATPEPSPPLPTDSSGLQVQLPLRAFSTPEFMAGWTSGLRPIVEEALLPSGVSRGEIDAIVRESGRSVWDYIDIRLDQPKPFLDRTPSIVIGGHANMVIRGTERAEPEAHIGTVGAEEFEERSLRALMSAIRRRTDGQTPSDPELHARIRRASGSLRRSIERYLEGADPSSFEPFGDDFIRARKESP